MIFDSREPDFERFREYTENAGHSFFNKIFSLDFGGEFPIFSRNNILNEQAFKMACSFGLYQ